MSHPTADAQNGKQVSPPPYTPVGESAGDALNAARGESPLIEAVERLARYERIEGGGKWPRDCVRLTDVIDAIQRHEPQRVDERIEEAASVWSETCSSTGLRLNRLMSALGIRVASPEELDTMLAKEYASDACQYSEPVAVEQAGDEVRPYLRPTAQAAGGDEYAFGLLRDVCNVLDHGLDVQSGSALHHCISKHLADLQQGGSNDQ